MPIVTTSLLQRSKGGRGTVINMHWRSGVTKVTLPYIVNKQLDGAVKFRLVPLLSMTRVSYIQDFVMSGTLVVSHKSCFARRLYYMNFMLVLRPGEICL